MLQTSDEMGSARQLLLGRLSYFYFVQIPAGLQASREAHGGSQTRSQQALETTRELFISRIPHPASKKLKVSFSSTRKHLKTFDLLLEKRGRSKEQARFKGRLFICRPPEKLVTHISCSLSRARLHRDSPPRWTGTDTITSYLCTS